MKTKTSTTSATGATAKTNTHWRDDNGMQLCGGQGHAVAAPDAQGDVDCGLCRGRLDLPGGRLQQVDTVKIENWANPDQDPSERALRRWMAENPFRRVTALTYVQEHHRLLVVHEAR